VWIGLVVAPDDVKRAFGQKIETARRKRMEVVASLRKRVNWDGG